MVIDFSRLNSSSSLTGSTRTSASKDSVEAGKSAPLESAAEQVGTAKSGESVHLSNEAQQLQKVNDKLRDHCLLYTSPSPRDRQKSRMPSSA